MIITWTLYISNVETKISTHACKAWCTWKYTFNWKAFYYVFSDINFEYSDLFMQGTHNIEIKYQPFRDSNLNEKVSNGHNSVDMCNHSTKLDKSIFVKFKSKWYHSSYRVNICLFYFSTILYCFINHSKSFLWVNVGLSSKSVTTN